MSTEKSEIPQDERLTGRGRAWWFSAAGVAAVALIVIGINYISRNVPTKVDFTANKFYSLTSGTKKILEKIDTPVAATLFVSEGKELPPELISRVRDVENLLLQYEQASPKDLIKFKKVYPAPDTEAAEQAALAGVAAQDSRTGPVYFSLSVSCLDKRENVEFLPLVQSGHEEQFEYEISRAIANVLASKKKVIGLMSALPITGGGMPNPMMGGAPRPWILYQQLKRDYDVQSVEMTAEKIDDKIDVLIVIHPAGITDQTQFAIDQFLLKGKPVVAMLDPHSIAAKISQGRQNPQMPMMGGPTSSTLPKLLPQWGYSFDANQVVADVIHKTPLRGNRESPCFLTLGGEAVNKSDVVTSQLGDVMFVFSGAFTGKAADGLTEDILLKTSPQNEMVSPMEAENSDDSIMSKFKPSGREKILAVRLSGKFKSAFPDGKPKKEEEKKDEGKKDEEKKEEEKPADAPHSKEMEEGKSGLLILVADTDFVYDNFCVQLLGPQIAIPFNSNLPLAMNIVDQVGGDTNLVQIRSRGSNRRGFTEIDKIEADANEKIRSQITELQSKADEANRKLTDLQAKKDPKQKAFLSPEQQNEIEQFRKEQADSSRKIRELKKEARKDIDSRLATMKAWNIIGVPLLIAALGVAVAVIRKKRTSAH